MRRYGWILTMLLAVPVISCSRKAGPNEVAIVLPEMSSSYSRELIAGAESAGRKLGLTVTVAAPEPAYDATEQSDTAQTMVMREMKAVSVYPLDDSRISKVCKEANQKKIPFIIYGTTTPLSSGKVTAYVGFNERDAGRQMGEYAVVMLRGAGKVGILSGEEGTRSRELITGFKDGIKDFPDIKVVRAESANRERAKASAAIGKMLKAQPSIGLILTADDEMALGAVDAVKKAHKRGIYIFCIGGSKDAARAVKAGDISVLFGTRPGRMGAAIVETIKEAKDRKVVPQVIETETMIVDAANVDEYLASR